MSANKINLLSDVVTGTGAGPWVKIPPGVKIESVHLVFGDTATAKIQVSNDGSNAIDLTSGDSADAGYSVGQEWEWARGNVTAWTSGDVNAWVRKGQEARV